MRRMHLSVTAVTRVVAAVVVIMVASVSLSLCREGFCATPTDGSLVVSSMTLSMDEPFVGEALTGGAFTGETQLPLVLGDTLTNEDVDATSGATQHPGGGPGAGGPGGPGAGGPGSGEGGAPRGIPMTSLSGVRIVDGDTILEGFGPGNFGPQGLRGVGPQLMEPADAPQGDSIPDGFHPNNFGPQGLRGVGPQLMEPGDGEDGESAGQVIDARGFTPGDSTHRYDARGPHGVGPRGLRGGGMTDKSGDTTLMNMLAETVDKFQQLTYTDEESGITLAYNLFIPENYNAKKKYPLLLFIADASTAQREVTAPLTQGYGGVIWATAEDQAKHPCFILVPQYSSVTVGDNFYTSDEVEVTISLLKSLCNEYSINTKRLYTTGQSMGGMMSMHFNVAHPGLFAASLYVGCQWDTSKMAGFAKDNFIYVVAGGDERASAGMAALREVLEDEGKEIASAEWSAKLPIEEQEADAKALLAEKNNVNFIVFTKGSVLPPDGRGMEHMCSFDYAYRLTPLRDWLFTKKLKK